MNTFKVANAFSSRHKITLSSSKIKENRKEEQQSSRSKLKNQQIMQPFLTKIHEHGIQLIVPHSFL